MQSCIYEYYPRAGKYEKFLVVYGMITTENGPHEITIYKTRQIGEHSLDSLSQAIVTISDDIGNIIPLTEASNGTSIVKLLMVHQSDQSIGEKLNNRQ